MGMQKTPYMIKDTDIITSSFEQPYILRVRDLADEDKPREKLLKHGPDILSSAELLAVVLNVGTKKEELFTMVSRVLKEYGERSISSETNAEKLSLELDIPIGKAAQIVACFELGRRFFKHPPRPAIIRSARQAYEYLREMGSLPKEHLRGLYLNSRYRVIHDEVISIGTLTSSIVHPREVFRPAIEYGAAAVIIAHNHPSGDSTPNEEDISITKQLKEAGEIMGVELLDHIVIGKDSFKSIIQTQDYE